MIQAFRPVESGLKKLCFIHNSNGVFNIASICWHGAARVNYFVHICSSVKILSIVIATILLSGIASLLLVKSVSAQSPNSLNLGSPVFIEQSKTTYQKQLSPSRVVLELAGNGTLLENGTTIKTTDKIYANVLNGTDGTIKIHGRAILTTAAGGQAMAIFYQKIDTQTGKDAGIVMISSTASGNLKFLRNEVLVFHSDNTDNDTSTQTFWLLG